MFSSWTFSSTESLKSRKNELTYSNESLDNVLWNKYSKQILDHFERFQFAVCEARSTFNPIPPNLFTASEILGVKGGGGGIPQGENWSFTPILLHWDLSHMNRPILKL